ncbi:MAG: hypothetical protein GY829_13345 [Gammaproteobacteria bacterium]|nr:hypothetical protein [Gammaproteobacteria bacterium]
MPQYKQQFTPAASGSGVWVVESSVVVADLTPEQQEGLIEGVEYVNDFIAVVSATSRAHNEEKNK